MKYLKDDEYHGLNERIVRAILENYRVKDVAYQNKISQSRVRYAMCAAGISSFYLTSEEIKQIMEQRKKNKQLRKDQQVTK